MSIKATKIIHKGETRIKVEFPFDEQTVTKLRQIPNTKWSSTQKSWHIPYTSSAFEYLKLIFPEVEYPETKLETTKPTEIENDTKINTNNTVELQNRDETHETTFLHELWDKNEISIDVIGRQIILKMPKNDLDVHFVQSLRYSHWDKLQFRWIIPNYDTNLDLLKEYFNNRIGRITIHQLYEIDTKPGQKYNLQSNELLLIKTNNGRLKILFGFNKILTNAIKAMPLKQWDAKNKWWTIPYTENLFEQIKTLGEKQQLKVRVNQEEQLSDKVLRVSAKTVSNYRTCPENMILKLQELRYSEHTVKTYCNVFEEFINYYREFDLMAIDEKMIVSFIQYLVNERKVSTAYQNQTINAIKFYYEKVLGGTRQIYLIDRPRIEKTLPTVLSTTEVASIIKSIENIKHKTMLMLTYSSGLRISELLNMKVGDIDSKRKHIKIEQGKGRKDRFTVLSEKVLPMLRDYYSEYKPKYYLFEGPDGKQYSSTSVSMILRAAVIKAGISKRVTMHTLRHSFATHLLEQGTDIRYIQSLLGHEDPRTTQIYTHITTKGFDQIKSPLDTLEF